MHMNTSTLSHTAKKTPPFPSRSTTVCSLGQLGMTKENSLKNWNQHHIPPHTPTHPDTQKHGIDINTDTHIHNTHIHIQLYTHTCHEPVRAASGWMWSLPHTLEPLCLFVQTWEKMTGEQLGIQYDMACSVGKCVPERPEWEEVTSNQRKKEETFTHLNLPVKILDRMSRFEREHVFQIIRRTAIIRAKQLLDVFVNMICFSVKKLHNSVQAYVDVCSCFCVCAHSHTKLMHRGTRTTHTYIHISHVWTQRHRPMGT